MDRRYRANECRYAWLVMHYMGKCIENTQANVVEVHATALNATPHLVSNASDEDFSGCNVLLSVLLFLSLQKRSPSIQLHTHRLFPTVQEDV